MNPAGELIVSTKIELDARSRSQNVNSRVQDEPPPSFFFFLSLVRGGGEETRDKHETRPTKECKQTVDHLYENSCGNRRYNTKGKRKAKERKVDSIEEREIDFARRRRAKGG